MNEEHSAYANGIPALLSPVPGSEETRPIMVVLVREGDDIVNARKVDLGEHTGVFFSIPQACKDMVKKVYEVDMSDIVSYNDNSGFLIPVTQDQVDAWMEL